MSDQRITSVLDDATIERVVAEALREDAPNGDITTLLTVNETDQARALLVAREAGVMAGEAVFEAAFHLTDPSISVVVVVHDGERFRAGDTLAEVTGSARAILTAERVALNFVQRMSGIATTTAEYVARVAGTGATILDTRKTTPLLRAVERHAVRCGGASNHRLNLSTAFMAKDNHLAMLARTGESLTEALRRIRAELADDVLFEVEVDRLDQIEAVIDADIDIIMLDNFSVDELRHGVELVAGRAKVEASGGVSLATVAQIAATGVDYISVGALTHNIRSLDLGLDVVDDA